MGQINNTISQINLDKNHSKGYKFKVICNKINCNHKPDKRNKAHTQTATTSQLRR